MFRRSAASVVDTRPQWHLVPQADNCSSSVVGLSGVLLSCRAACPAIRCLSTAALKTQDAAALPTHRSCALALSLSDCSAIQRSNCPGLGRPAAPLWCCGTRSLLPLAHCGAWLVYHCPTLSMDASYFDSRHRHCATLNVSRPICGSSSNFGHSGARSCSLCHSQLSIARPLGALRRSATPVLGRSMSAAEDAWRKASPSLLLWCSAPRLVCPQLLALLPLALACSCARSPPALGHPLAVLALANSDVALALIRFGPRPLLVFSTQALSAISPSGAQFWRPTTPWCSQAISRSGAQLPSTPCLSAAQSWRFPVTSRSDAHGHLGSQAVKTRSLSVSGAQFEISHSAVLFASQPN